MWSVSFIKTIRFWRNACHAKMWWFYFQQIITYHIIFPLGAIKYSWIAFTFDMLVEKDTVFPMKCTYGFNVVCDVMILWNVSKKLKSDQCLYLKTKDFGKLHVRQRCDDSGALMTYHTTENMAQCKTAVSPLLTHWRYCSIVLSHRHCQIRFMRYITSDLNPSSSGLLHCH